MISDFGETLNSKKGISAIVATVLIILVTVAAVAILWVTVLPMITKATTFKDPNLRLELVTSEGYTTYDPHLRLATIQVRRGSDKADLIGFDLIFLIEGNSVKHFVSDFPAPNQAKVYYINLSNYSIPPSLVRVAPVFTDGTIGNYISQVEFDAPEVDLGPLANGNPNDGEEEFKQPNGGYSGGGGSSGGTTNPPVIPTCVLMTCAANYSGLCGSSLSDGCSGTLDCSNNCGFEQGCNLGVCEALNYDCADFDTLCVDDNNVSGIAEYSTIQSAVNTVLPGQVVLVRDGTYNEQIDIQRYVGVNGNETHQVTIRNYPGERPYLKGNKDIRGWTRCDTGCNALRDITGEINPYYHDIFYTDIAIADYTSNIPKLYERGIPLEIAIDPDQSDSYLENTLEFTPLTESENIELHNLVGINHIDDSIRFEDPLGEYSPLFKQGQEIVVSNKTNPHSANNGSFVYILEQDGIYNNDGTTTLFVSSDLDNLIDSLAYGIENTRFIRDSNLTEVSGYWNGSTIDFWTHGANNVILTRKVSSSHPGKIVFDVPLLRFISFRGSYPDAYALVNHPAAISKPGEYIYSGNGTHYRIYLYPRSSADLETGIDALKYDVGFYIYPNYNYVPSLSWGNYITFSGFEVGFYVDRCIFQREGTANKIIVDNNYVHDCGEGISFQDCLNCRINNNTVINTFTGFGVVAQGENVTVSNNFVDNIRRTLIIPGGKNIALINNTMGAGGSHSNGMAIYEGNLNILVMGNRFMGPVGLTLERCENVTVYNNIIENAGVSDWGDSENFYFYNNFFGGGIDFDSTSAVAKNNFASWFSPNLQTSNNINVLEIDRSASFRNSYAVRGSTNQVELEKMASYGEDVNSNWTNVREDYTHLITVGDYIVFSDYLPREVTKVEGVVYYGNWVTKISFEPSIEHLEQAFQIWKYIPTSFDVDYHHKENGVGIDNGTGIVFPKYLDSSFFSQFNLNTDIEENPRPSGSAWDIGPYEYQG
jgi:parallel beta-helix repeat protein